MNLPSLNQINGFLLIVNSFLPLVFLGLILLTLNAAITQFHHQSCSSIKKAATTFTEIDRIKNLQQFEQLTAVSTANKVNRETQLATECDIEFEINQLLSNDLYAKTKKNIELQINSVGNKFDRIKDTIDDSIPSLPDINLKKVNLKIIFPPKKISFPARLNVDVGKPINIVINAMNSLDNKINSALKKFGASISKTLTGTITPEKELIQLEIKKFSHKQSVFWGIVKELLLGIQQAIAKFYWLSICMVLWTIISYIFWAYNRISKGFKLIKS